MIATMFAPGGAVADLALAHPLAGGAVAAALVAAALVFTRGPGVVHRRPARLALRILAAAAIGFAVAGPSASTGAPPLRAELLDASASFRPRRAGAEVVLQAARERALALGVRTERIAFADGVGARAFPASTDVAGGIAAALAAGATEVVLASDGLATTPGALEAAARAARMGVPVHAALPERSPGSDLRIEAVRLPARVRPGAPVALEVDVALDGASPIEARITARFDGAPGPAEPSGGARVAIVSLPAGGGRATAALSLTAPTTAGLAEVVLTLEPRLDDDLVPEDETARPAVLVETVGRVLVVATPEAAAPPATGRDLASLLADATRVAPTRFPADEATLSAFDAVVLVDASADELGVSGLEACARYVEQGGALLALGARGAFGEGGYAGTALERVLPVLSSPPGPSDRLAVAVAVDRSGSMGEAAAPGITKHAAALRALEQALRGLSSGDLALAVSFAREAEVVRPLGPLGDPGALVAALAARGTAGETDLYPALRASIEAVRAAPAERRHVLLLSDGRSEATPDPRAALEGLVVPPEVTVSVVAVGRDADAALLGAIAARGRGRFTEAAAGGDRLGAVLARELDPRRLPPTAEGPFPLPSGATLARAARVQAKPSARTLLSLEGVGPLLVEGEAGAGRAVAYASDDPTPCAREVAAALDAALRPPSRPGVTLAVTDDGARLLIEAIFEPSAPMPVTAPAVGASPAFPLSARLSDRADLVPLEESAPRRFRASIDRPARAVSVALVAAPGGRPLATAVHAPARPLEHIPAPADDALLRAIASVTGGRFAGPGEAIPDPRPASRMGRAAAGHWALLVALLLLALDVALGAAAGAARLPNPVMKVLDKRPSVSA